MTQQLDPVIKKLHDDRIAKSISEKYISQETVDNLPRDILLSLVNLNATNIYFKYKITAETLCGYNDGAAQYSLEKIEAIIKALENLYGQEFKNTDESTQVIDIDYLKDFDANKIKAIAKALPNLEKHNIGPKDIESFTSDKIEALSSYSIDQICENSENDYSPRDFISFDTDKIKAIAASYTIALFDKIHKDENGQEYKITLHDFFNMESNDIYSFTSRDGAREVYTSKISHDLIEKLGLHLDSNTGIIDNSIEEVTLAGDISE